MRVVKKTRGQWSSGFGFMMAAAGAAVGLGNIWGFPYKLGEGGGFVFLAAYLFFVVAVGYPVLLGELAIGRKTASGAIGAYQTLGKRYRFVGVLGVGACFLILGYYVYFGGLIMDFAAEYTGNLLTGSNALVTGEHGSFVSVLWLLAFVGVTFVIVLRGVQGGIELCSKFMMPALLVMLIYLAGKSLALPGAGDALRYLFVPDLDKLTPQTISSALTQVFFSLSLGQGIMVTYGSYLGKKENLERSAAIIPILDTLVAVLAAVVIIPAVFSFGLAPDAGPNLMFDALPLVFSEMRGGNVLGFLFFLLLFFAAVTSSISMLETVASALTEQLKVRREKAVPLVAIFAALMGIPVCLDRSLFLTYEYVSQYIMVSLGALIMCLLLGWGPGRGMVEQEAALGDGRFHLERPWRFLIRYVSPVLVLFVLLISLGIFKI